MSDEQSGGNLWIGVVAVIVIGVVGYFIYVNSRGYTGKTPEVTISRDEAMKQAMPEASGSAGVEAAPENKKLKTLKAPGGGS